MERKKHVIVVGGGPAGMMAAIRASQLGAQVTLIEKNASLGKKLLITGKGRCNLTNACGLDEFIKRFGKNGKFLRDAFKVFFSKELMAFFEKRGLPLKVERQQRVFPVSDRSLSVLNILINELRKNKVEIKFEKAVEDIIIESNRVTGVVLRNKKMLTADNVVIATGGLSYPDTGSNGKGIEIIKRKGHKVVSLAPGLVALKVKQKYVKDLQGLTLKNTSIKFISGKKKIVSNVGELLFTDVGISGPLVLTLSGKVLDLLDNEKLVKVKIDIKIGLSRGQVDSRLLREIEASPKKTVKGILRTLLPQRFVDVFLSVSKIDPNKLSSQLLKEERGRIAGNLKSFGLQIIGSEGFKCAMVTKGGISLKEINPRTMGSKLIKGLFFAGEMIDLDGDTGGFNLQAAFSTGYLAGQNTLQN